MEATMGDKKTESLKRKKHKLLDKLRAHGDMIRGSLVKTRKKCGRDGCRCESGELHPHSYLSTSGKKGNTIVYVRPGQEAEFRRGVKAYRKALSLLDEISRVNIEIIKGGNADEK
jgi:hypothetical protein